VIALIPVGYQVFAVNPLSASHYRHSVSGAKSDPGEANPLDRVFPVIFIDAGLYSRDPHGIVA
jgi:hypothetical protein